MATDKAIREKDLTEPSPKNVDLFNWLERRFNGSTEWPEKLEVRVLSGPRSERMGPLVFNEDFDTTSAAEVKDDEETEKKKETKSVRRLRGKPGREEIAGLTNEITHAAQRDCDAQRKSVVYGVLPWNFRRGDSPYDRFLIRCTPQGVHAPGDGESDGDDDEYATPRHRYDIQKLGQDAKFFELHVDGIASLLDRQDRALEREAQTAERLRQSNERLMEINHKLVTQEHERLQQAKWTDLKIRSAEKVLDLSVGLAPTFFGKLTGKKASGIEESPESLTLKRFLKLHKDGGALTSAQADAAFGVFDENGPDPKKQIKPGILSAEQLQVLLDVAFLDAPTDALDKLLPGGPLGVTQEQIFLLSPPNGVFPMEQITPIIAMIGLRMQGRIQQQASV